MSNDKTTKTKKQRSKAKEEAEPAGSFQRSTRSERVASDRPAQQFRFVLGPNDQAIHDHIRCVFDPRNYKSGVPVSRGGFELYTKLWDDEVSGIATASADGTLSISVCVPNWVEDGNSDGTPMPTCSTLGYTNSGQSVFYTDGTANHPTLPEIGTNMGVTAGMGWIGQRNPMDQPLTSRSRLRLVACELRVWSTEPRETAKGEVLLVGSVNPIGDLQGGAVAGMDWSGLIDTSDDVMARSQRAIPGWGSSDMFSVVSIPAEEQAFDMVVPPADAYNSANALYPIPTIACLGRGMAAGQKLNFSVFCVWESEAGKSKQVGYQTKRPKANLSEVENAMQYAHPLSAGVQPNAHVLPFLASLSERRPEIGQILSKHPAVAPLFMPPTAPPRPVPSKVPTGFPSMVVHNPNWWDRIKGIHGQIAASGALKNIPVIGTAVNTAANWLQSFLG